VFIIDSSLGLLIAIAERYSHILNNDVTIGTLDAINNNSASTFLSWVSDCLLLLEYEHTWLVIIENSDSSDRIITDETSIGLLVVKLDVEILIRLPFIVINNRNCNFFFVLSAFELNNLVDMNKIFTILCISFLGSNPDATCTLRLVKDLNFDGTSSLTNRVVEACEAKLRVLFIFRNQGSLLVLSAQDLVLCNCFLLVIKCYSFSVTDSFNESWPFKLSFKIFFVYFRCLSGTELLHQELLHLC